MAGVSSSTRRGITIGYDWPLFTKKKSASQPGNGCRSTRSQRRRLPPPDRHPWKSLSFAAALPSSTLKLWLADQRGGHAPRLRGRLQADGSACHRQAKQGADSPADRIDRPDAFREVWKTHRSQRWLFPSRRLTTHLPDATASGAFIKARDACGFNSDFRPHSLRHTASPLTCSSVAWISASSRSCSRTLEPAIHRDLHPSDRAANAATNSANYCLRPPTASSAGREPSHGWILAFALRRGRSSWRTSSADSALDVAFPSTASGCCSSHRKASCRHRRLLHSRTGGTASTFGDDCDDTFWELPLLPEPRPAPNAMEDAGSVVELQERQG